MQTSDSTSVGGNQKPVKIKSNISLETQARNIHRSTRESKDVRDFFNGRGISNSSIDRFMLGLAEFDEHHRFSIPIFDRDGKVAYIKLFRTPADDLSEVVAEMLKGDPIPKYTTYPTDASPLLVGEDLLVKSTSSDVLICDDELDRIIAIQEGVKMPVVASGEAKFKDEWIDSLTNERNVRNIYVCIENDAEDLMRRLAEHIPTASIYKVLIPHANLINYFVEKRGTVDELFSKHVKFYCGKKPIDPAKFEELTVDDVAKILDLTIKDNYANKVIIFLAMLLTYTENSQLNIIMNAESSSGKTYLVNEISDLFPAQDVYQYGNASPTSPYHNEKFKKIDEHGMEYSDLEKRILIFEDQPNPQLLANLRSFLSHDLKKTPFMLTNKNKSGKITAPESYILGFSSVFFCSANLRIDGQEQTRSFILSPENTEETIRASVDACIDRDSNELAYQKWLNSNEDRNNLKDRILYIKNLKVDHIGLCDKRYVKTRFYEDLPFVTPGTRRKIKQFMALIKGMALLNAPFRTTNGKIVATNDDVDEAMKLWSVISESMSYGLPPEVLDFYKTYVLQAYFARCEFEKGIDGITADELAMYYYDQNGRGPNFDMIRKVYIPTLKRAKFIRYDRDKNNGQRWLITPLVFFDDEGDGMEETD